MNPAEELTFDLNNVLKNKTLGLGFDHILIVEWLFDNDVRTGSSLYKWLSDTLPAGKVEYVSCVSQSELEACLNKALRDIPVRGVPIIHIEAHGEDPAPGKTPDGFVGPDGSGGRELLSWERLGDILRPLNIASRFNLLVVGAACYGEGLMLGASGGKAMPFVAVVGYTDTISQLSLKHSLLELYRGLLLDKSELGLATEAADREHHSPDDAILRPTSMVALLAESFIEGSAIKVRKLRAEFPLDSAAPQKAGLASMSATALEVLRRGLNEAWSVMWMMERFPENAERFAIDVDQLIQIAIEYADLESNRHQSDGG